VSVQREEKPEVVPGRFGLHERKSG
jgi:hypothetical protein